MINFSIYVNNNIIVRLLIDWYGMVYSCAGSLDYFIPGLACESIRFSFALRRFAKRPQRRRVKEKQMLSQAIPGYLTSNLMSLSFSPLCSSSSWGIDIVVFAETSWIFYILKFCIQSVTWWDNSCSLNQSKEGAFDNIRAKTILTRISGQIYHIHINMLICF